MNFLMISPQAKIWIAMGDIIKPGHGYDLTGNSSNKPPKAKETLCVLSIAYFISLHANTCKQCLPRINILLNPNPPISTQLLHSHTPTQHILTFQRQRTRAHPSTDPHLLPPVHPPIQPAYFFYALKYLETKVGRESWIGSECRRERGGGASLGWDARADQGVV
jgi:hypothetical protein